MQEDTEYLLSQWHEVFDLVETYTQCSDAWYQTTRRFLGWFLEASGFSTEEIGRLSPYECYQFDSWEAPSTTERDERAEALFVRLDDVLKSR